MTGAPDHAPPGGRADPAAGIAVVDLGRRGPRDPLADAKAGDEIVFDDVSYFFLRKGLENRVIAISSQGAPLEIPDPATGIPMPPTPSTIVAAMRAHRLFLRSEPLPDAVRAAARAEEPASNDVWHKDRNGFFDRCDAGAKLRDLVVRAWDATPAKERPMRTDTPLRAWVEDRPDMAAALAAYGRTPAGSTLRHWINHRGREGDRRAADMPSRSGKVERSRRFPDLVLLIGRLHALCRVSSRRKSTVEFTRFKRSVAKANAGEEVVINGAALRYERPAEPMKPYGLTTFRLECRRARSMMTDAMRSGPGARRQLHGGGGAAQEPARFLEIVQQDDSPFPNWFLIDDETRTPIGPATVVLTLDVFTKVILGWDVSLESPSTSTWLRALAHCGIPKPTPAFLEEEFPEVGDLYGWISGKVVYDNALQNVGHAAQDAAGDLAHAITVAGEGEPTHKAEVERVGQTVQGYMKEVAGVSLDIAAMRRFGYDPRKHVAVTVSTFRRLVDEAIQTYHTQPHKGHLGDRSPLQVWMEEVARWGHRQAKDVDQFIRSIGDVHLDVRFDRNGCEIEGLRFSGGTAGNEQLLADLASSGGVAIDDEPMVFAVKVKSYDTIGEVSVWNPKIRRYVPVPSTQRRLSKGMPWWLFRKIRDYAEQTRREFRTDDQMAAAREAFSASIEAAMPEATARQQKLFGSMLDAENVRRHLGSEVVIKRVTASASGMAAEVVEHEGRAATRQDGMRRTARPGRGGANAARAAKQAAAEQKAIADLAKRDRREPPWRPQGRGPGYGSGAPKPTTGRKNGGGDDAGRNAQPRAMSPLKPAPFT